MKVQRITFSVLVHWCSTRVLHLIPQFWLKLDFHLFLLTHPPSPFKLLLPLLFERHS